MSIDGRARAVGVCFFWVVVPMISALLKTTFILLLVLSPQTSGQSAYRMLRYQIVWGVSRLMISMEREVLVGLKNI